MIVTLADIVRLLGTAPMLISGGVVHWQQLLVGPQDGL
jgi:hypothetical protein